jgi:hypothetical protein
MAPQGLRLFWNVLGITHCALSYSESKYFAQRRQLTNFVGFPSFLSFVYATSTPLVERQEMPWPHRAHCSRSPGAAPFQYLPGCICENCRVVKCVLILNLRAGIVPPFAMARRPHREQAPPRDAAITAGRAKAVHIDRWIRRSLSLLTYTTFQP